MIIFKKFRHRHWVFNCFVSLCVLFRLWTTYKDNKPRRNEEWDFKTRCERWWRWTRNVFVRIAGIIYIQAITDILRILRRLNQLEFAWLWNDAFVFLSLSAGSDWSSCLFSHLCFYWRQRKRHALRKNHYRPHPQHQVYGKHFSLQTSHDNYIKYFLM